MKYSTKQSKFQLANLLSIISLFVVILAGGIVRSSGSGMGCPDWPKCFGKFIPPTQEAQLPKNYRTNYVERQLKKNQRFANMLAFLGYNSLALKVKSDTSVATAQQEEFNPVKTWTEYINRLIGVIAGILLLATAFYSFSYFKKNRLIVFLSVFNLVLIFIQAWLGSVVVSSNLVPWIVTVHMLVALLILAISIYTWHKVKTPQHKNENIQVSFLIKTVTILALILEIIQISIGTEVREKIDEYAAKLNGDNRQNWVNGAEGILLDHKNMALAVIAINVFLYLLLRKHFDKSSIQRQLMSIGFMIIMLQILAGVALSYWSLPPFAQTLHIFLASLLFGTQFYMLLNMFKSAQNLKI